MAVLATQVEDARKEAGHWKIQAQQAFKERDLAKQSLAAAGGPALFWRAKAKDLATEQQRTNEHIGKLRKALTDERFLVIQHAEQVDALKARIEDHRKALWTVWTELDETHPLKQRLWTVWSALA